MIRLQFAAILATAFAAMVLVSFPRCTPADEGMWLFSNPPRKILKEKYQFDPTDEWLAHLRLSSVRFNSGGSGSFVSSDGLVMTNHHVGADALQKMSTKDKDFIKTGFYAKTREEEVRCLDLELNVLESIEDVTSRVNAAVKPEMTPAEAFRLRRAATNTIEKEVFRKDRPAQRRHHALPGRAVPALPLQEVHRRPVGLRPGDGDRLFRWRSGQFRVSAVRSGHLLLSGL